MRPEGGGGSRLGWVLLEAALIVAGLGGTWLATEAQEKAQRREAAEAAKAAMVNELLENWDRTIESRDHHFGITSTLGRYLQGGEPEPQVLREVFDQGFARPAEIFDVAWETAGETGALRDLSTLDRNAFADAYARLDAYRVTSREVGAILYQAIWDEGLDGVYGKWREVVTIVGTLWYQECRALDAVRSTLERVELSGIEGVEIPEDPMTGLCSQMLQARGG